MDFEFKKTDLANLTPILYQLEERMELYKLPKFSTFKKSAERNADASVSRDGKEFSISTAFLRTPDKIYEKLEQFQKKYGYRYRAVADRDDYVRATVDHELGHVIASKYYLSSGVLDRAFSKDLRNALGYYATTSPDEYFAECIAAYLGPLRKEMNETELGLVEDFFKENDITVPSLKDTEIDALEGKFRGMMKALFKEEGASLRIELLEDPAVTGFINAHASVLDGAFAKVEMSETMRAKLRKSDYIFSGIKTFHELNEAFPSLLDENGNRKPFNQFLNDVQAIDSTYNKAYLSAEYNHAQAAAEMAAKWEDYEEDGDEYNLQYRTAGDDKVRPEHAALHGVTLPMSDPFWDEYYPPNGWNCRCTVVQVLKDKYPTTDRGEALRRGQEALAKDTKGIFRFNPGKQEKAFPDYNAYTLSKCNTCTRKLNLAKGVAENELCEACLLVRAMAKDSVSMAAERIAAFDQGQWEHTYVSEKADGLVVIEHERIRESTKHPNEEEKFQKERGMCIDLADQGHDIQLFHGEGRPKGETYDILFNGIPADLKCIEEGGSSIPKYTKHAFREQGAEIVIYKLPSHSLYGKLKEAHRKYGAEGKIYFYFADDTRLREIKK